MKRLKILDNAELNHSTNVTSFDFYWTNLYFRYCHPYHQAKVIQKIYDTFEKNPILTPHFFFEILKMIFPNQYESEVKEIALITIDSPRSYQRKILAIFAKEENKLLLWDNQKRKTEDIKKCRSQRDVVGKTQISCQFTQPGVYQVFLYSLGQTQKDINKIGQLKFHAL